METVTTDRLFRVHKPVTILGRKLSVRCLSGPETQDRNRYSLLAGLNLEKKLRDHASDDYAATLSGYVDLDRSGLIAYLTMGKLAEFQAEAEERVPAIYLPFPDGSTDAEQRLVLEQREKDETERRARIDSLVAGKLKEYEASLADTPLDELLTKVHSRAIANAVERAANSAYAYYGLFLAVCDERGERYFTSPKEAEGVPDPIAIMLLTEFKEVNNLDPLASNGPSSTASPASGGA